MIVFISGPFVSHVGEPPRYEGTGSLAWTFRSNFQLVLPAHVYPFEPPNWISVPHALIGRTEASKRRSHEGSTAVDAATSARAIPVAPESKLRSTDHPPSSGRQDE